ncbi:MAG: circularly permuted type 2 ATP-grasp protein [Thiohalocapsa sp.]|nr:circularly permuted type 2 ATP-grasp protein [Thiohalocapsa sp.]MCF7990974.1 circularly permuted type 2 ATP-grasp protein [Thiohalocapsa sp.]
MTIDWSTYPCEGFYDELLEGPGRARVQTRALAEDLAALGPEELGARQEAAEVSIKEMGITFTVYSEEGGAIDRTWPFDVIPRVIPEQEWRRVEAGLKQRVQALNLFIDDLYHDQKIVADGVFPAEVLAKSANFRPQCVGVDPPLGIWAHVCGSDLVRDGDGTLYVLEDNLRVPSGVSYMLENRLVTKRVFPELFEHYAPLPVDDYPSQLFDTLAALSPRPAEYPEVVVLTPGIYNSAYFEHSYLAQQMGAELVEGRDLFVDDDDCCYMRTIDGPARVDVIYRRVDDLFLDPEAFLPDSMLGVPGLVRAWKAGNVALANAPGAGVADDKVVYAFVPEIIKYYLDEDPIIPNVPTFRCMEADARKYVLEHLSELVVKPANESGGYGMLVGPASTQAECDKFAALIKKDPRNYIAQPTLRLSTVPTVIKGNVEPRHVDLRPFILSADRQQVTMGGLTRVALRKGSLVVNSSQGGGSKDTWIVPEWAAESADGQLQAQSQSQS